MVNTDGRQAALAFLNVLREEQALREQLAERRDNFAPEDLVSFGASLGFYFNTKELSQAFRQDWLLRWLHFLTKKELTP
jgi:hypothetical protein